MESLCLWVAEGTCWGGELNNVKGKFTFTFGIISTLASSVVSSQPLYSCPLLPVGPRYTLRWIPGLIFYVSFFPDPAALCPGQYSTEILKQFCSSISFRTLSKFPTYFTQLMVWRESGSVDGHKLQPDSLSQCVAGRIKAPLKMTMGPSSPEPVNSYFASQKGLCRYN